MAKLTPLSKGLIAFAIIAVAGAAIYHLGFSDPGEVDPLSEGDPSVPTFGGDGGALGTKSNPLKVSIVSFHGYAPALVANGNSLTTQPGSIFDKAGVNVELVIQDDIPTLSTIFTSKTAHCSWRTSDFWAQEHPNLRNAGLDAKAVVVVDNTQGADAVIATDPKVNSIEDLAGKSIALLQYTPSDGMVIDAIDNSSLTARKKNSIKFIYVNPDEGLAGVRAALESGNADAAALWDPDLSLAATGIDGAHVIYSTATATNLVYDVIVCDTRHLDDPANDAAFQGFVQGWLEGVTAAESDPDNAVRALRETEEFFDLLAREEGDAFVKGLFDGIVWTGLEDNARILGMAGGTNHYERVYKRFDGIYRGAGALANPNSPVINPQDSFEYKYVQKLLAEDAAAKAAAAKPQFVFTEKERDEAHARQAQLTKPITINFATGSAELTKRSEQIIDDEMVPLIENNGAAYFEVSGNTDSTGSRGTNMTLSGKRAAVVVDYLVLQWEFPRERFVVVGYGPDKPICDESNPAAEELSLEDCRSANRTTRLAIHSRG
ncbi:MAG TPA: phosphate ABC transporter substrate-binding/OmpA family protein [Myxococcota bacterium]|nr:phosphate ABC transporter substrate-binding/OmpA family protein [Myxococcota bacterium]